MDPKDNSNKDKETDTNNNSNSNRSSSTLPIVTETSKPTGDLNISNPVPLVSNAIIPSSTQNPTSKQTIQNPNPIPIPIPTSNTNINAAGTKEKHPNSIIFYIESNLYSFNFIPQMLVPDIKSETVFINPLVEYTRRGIRDIPDGAPKTKVLSQFFIANEFEMMINRILSDFTSMQRKRTYKEAKDEGVIDTDIELTVNTLFKTNNVLYIGGKPYTIITHRYHKGDWDTDKKPSEQLVGISGDSEKAEKEADNELKELEKIDPTLLAGSASSRGLKIKNMLKQQQQQEQEQQQQKLEERQQGISAFEKTQIVSNKATLKKLPGFLNYLLGGDLRKNDPIGFEPPYSQMNPCEPITFTLVMGLTDNKFIDFVGDIDKNGDTGAKLYENYVTSKEAFLATSQHFFELISETIPDILEDYRNLTEEITDKIEYNVDDKQTKPVILLLSSKKKEYMRKIKELSETLKQIFVGQQEYFKNVIALIKYIKTNYVKMIGYKKSRQALLADKCVDFDIQVFETLISSSTSMSQTIEAYKAKHLKWFDVDFTTDFEQDTNTINASNELDKYKKNQELMYIELRQFELYMLIIMFHCFTNQSDIWKIFLDGLPGFIKSIADETTKKMAVLQTELTSYNSFVSTLGTSKNKSDVDMIRDFAKRISENESDYNLYNISNKDGFLTKTNPVTEQEKRFIGLKEKEIEVYEGILLFTSLLELRCLRQFNAYASEQNMFTLQEEIANTFEYYYEEIEPIIGRGDLDFMIPKSIMWSTEDLNNPANKTTVFIERKISSSERTKRLYEHKTDLINDSIKKMEEYCKTIHKMIDPVLDTDGLTNVCRNLQQGNKSKSTLIVDLLAFPDYETRLWQLKSIPKGTKNVELTDEFNSQMARVYRLYKLLEENNNSNYKDNTYQDWVVLNDFPTNTNVDKMLKELNGSEKDQETLNRIRQLLSCELIIFEMKSEPNDKMDYSFNYETGVGMKGGWGFSKIEDIQADFGLDCQGLNPLSVEKPFLFLVKVNNSYKLVYNTSKNLIPANNYLYSYDTISKNIKYVDNYIKTCDTKFSEDMETKTKAIVNETVAEEAKEDDNLTNAENEVEQTTDKLENLEEGTKEKAELLTDFNTKLIKKEKLQENVEKLKEELEDTQGVRRKTKKEPRSKLIYTKLQDTDISTIDDINQLKKIKSRIQGNITKASNEIDRISEDVRSQLGSNTKIVRDELKKHRLYNENVLKKEANEAKLAEIDDRILEIQGEQQIKKGGGYKPFGDSYKQVGGAGESARDRYYLTQGIQGLNTENYYGQQQQPYLQQQYGQQQPYGQQPMSQQPLYPSLNPFQRQRQYGQQPIPYGQQLINPLDQITYAKQMSYYNKALELESKLAFYVNVELTLFPGTSVNPLQKASALCSARFEDIRKAFTEIVGLEYRPRPLVDNTSYYNKEKEKQTKEIKRGGSIKNRKLKKNNTIRIKYKN